MKVTTTYIPKKIGKMFNKINKNGMSIDDCHIYVGECMELEDRLFTDGDLSHAMHEVFNEALKALKDNPTAQQQLKDHFAK